MRTKLLAALALCSATLLAACSHGYVDVGTRHPDHYYGHQEFLTRRPVVVEQRPVIIHDHSRDPYYRPDYRSANDRW